LKSAEAVYQHYHHNFDNELILLLESEQWESAHTVLMQKLVFRYILYEQKIQLTAVLDQLEKHKKWLKV
jgi:hypothetical protein